MQTSSVFTFVANGTLLCQNPVPYAKRLLCDQSNKFCGESATFVLICTGDRRTTSQWGQGTKVRGASIISGTLIATFSKGKYFGQVSIDISQSRTGIQARDQVKDIE